MKKRFMITMLLATFVAGTLFASDFSFKFGSLSPRSGYLGGFVPTYLNVGVGYDGLSLIDENKTEIEFYQGAGFTKRVLYQDPTTGEQIAAGHASETTTAGLFSLDSTINFNQGFFNDSLTTTLGVKGAYEMVYNDSILPGSNVYPDLVKNSNFYDRLIVSVKYDKMVDTTFNQDGYSGEVTLTYAPEFTNSTSDFLSGILDLQYAKTLYTIDASRDGRKLLSLVLVDRLLTSYTFGDKIPTSYQKKVALGSLVRGFTNYTYNTTFNVVNNLDLRVSTFEVENVLPMKFTPRFNFFLDTGFAMGDYFNSNVSIDTGDGFLMSTGLQATIDIGDRFDFGYQLAYLISGDNLAEAEGKSLVGSITFFLMF